MSDDATVLEAPVTPAPVFAYRALRSIFFTSPDSSPEHDNKENIGPPYAQSPMKPILALDEQLQLQLTPSHKRRWDGAGAAISPTKGILRTPGLATPRTKLLKDLNVKFKSVSPELVDTKKKSAGVGAIPADGCGREARHGVKSSKSMNDIAVPVTKKTTQPSQQTKNTTQPSQQKQHTAKSMPTVSASTITTEVLSLQVIEAYMQQTEKEMKKLVRYGQKMREYARKKDAENQELKSMIQQLKKENESLRSSVATDRDREGASSAGADAGRGYVREEVDRVEATVRSLHTGRSTSKPRPLSGDSKAGGRKASIAAMDLFESDIDSRAASKIHQSSTTSRRQSVAHAPAAKPSYRSVSLSTQTSRYHTSRDHNGSFPRVRPDTSSAATGTASASVTAIGTNAVAEAESAPETTSANEHVPPSTDTITGAGAGAGTGTARLPPDRLLAARERLRRRMEARKASTGSGVDDGTERIDAGDGFREEDQNQNQNQTHKANETEIQSGEHSQFDWLNI
ncbi:hypothetical protein A1O3_04558 [Capronia epimyces CBS 606.96]|uniref:Spindle pole body-associated protein cut12 domain-containing protein n=1 Tax=Capronia epimyces CBS 606.96 TaxID=1182542 RepID=W9Y453_9EURO|nr:uncharacterized protein A1O3_04558 [Capronia epimyces CBS 606.96]EXJ87597.1 hypothetical protein A1O3_04558 [Capronia epimyces CBS 606.96]